jgi:hypothetical protein
MDLARVKEEVCVESDRANASTRVAETLNIELEQLKIDMED